MGSDVIARGGGGGRDMEKLGERGAIYLPIYLSSGGSDVIFDSLRGWCVNRYH